MDYRRTKIVRWGLGSIYQLLTGFSDVGMALKRGGKMNMSVSGLIDWSLILHT